MLFPTLPSNTPISSIPQIAVSTTALSPCGFTESALTVNKKPGTKGTVVIDKAIAEKSGKQGEIPVPDEHPMPSFQEQVPNYQVPTAPGAGVGASIATSAALPTWAIVAAGVTAVAVPVAVIAANNNDNDPPPASPSSSHGRR